MKHLTTYLALITLCVISCTKPMIGTYHHIDHIEQFIRQHANARILSRIDWSKRYQSTSKENGTYHLIPLRTGDTTSMLIIHQGTKEELTGRILQWSTTTQTSNGWLRVSTLQEEGILASAVTNGNIDQWHIRATQTNVSMPDGPIYITLPEVIVVGSYQNSQSTHVTTYINLATLFNATSGGAYDGSGGLTTINYDGGSATGGWYIPVSNDPSAPSGDNDTPTTDPASPIGGFGTGPQVPNLPPIFVETELQGFKPAIDLVKYIEAFDQVPDAGAYCTIEIFSDIPVNNDPRKVFNFGAQSPGHTFINLTKTGSNKSVSQNIGFYPENHWKATSTTAPIPSKFVDNELHEFNASLKTTITLQQFKAMTNRILQLQNHKYDIDDYNCTNWAVEIFNTGVPANQYLSIAPMKIPGAPTPYGSSTPSGLFLLLQEKQQTGGIPNATISIPDIGWSGHSTGPNN